MENFYNEHDRLLVSVDCIVFGFDEGELRVLMGKRKMDWDADYGRYMVDLLTQMKVSTMLLSVSSMDLLD